MRPSVGVKAVRSDDRSSDSGRESLKQALARKLARLDLVHLSNAVRNGGEFL